MKPLATQIGLCLLGGVVCLCFLGALVRFVTWKVARIQPAEAPEPAQQITVKSQLPVRSLATNDLEMLRSGLRSDNVKFPGPGETVNAVYPDGLVIASNGGTVLRKVKFRDLPDSIQAQYGYDPQEAAEYEANQARWAANYQHDQARLAARQNAASREPTDQERQNIGILLQILSGYHSSHTYSLEDKFVCGDMACDVWNMVKTKGMQAKLFVGSVDRDITSIREANHVWVVAEVSPGTWLALETTAGRIVFPNENPRYYWGRAFENPKQYKEFSYGHP